MCVVLYGFGHLRGELVLSDREATAKTPADVPIVVGYEDVKRAKEVKK
jgi:hypothetical protein